MPEYLIIGGKTEDAAPAALAVAADLAGRQEAQVDIAAPVAHQDAVSLSACVRRVVGFDLTPSAKPDLSMDSLKQKAAGGWRGLLSAARGAARGAAENFEQYRGLRDELRLARYDMIIDLNADAGSVIIARLADSVKVAGFSAENLPGAAPGMALFYHDSYAVPSNLPRLEQCRRLAGRALNYEPGPQPGWNFKDFPRPEWTPAAPFILLGGKIPAPFGEILTGANLPLCGAPPAPAPPETISPPDLLALAAAAVCVAGNGLAAGLGAALRKPVFFIGGKPQLPPNAVLTDSPAALKESLDGVLRRLHPPAAPKSAPDSPSADSASSEGGLRIREN
ncbi:MAG: hypothetical protein ACR2P5_09635 [Gammaproteobacteria bacterium]